MEEKLSGEYQLYVKNDSQLIQSVKWLEKYDPVIYLNFLTFTPSCSLPVYHQLDL